jgi:signal peptide peptidase SppA
MKKSYVLQAFIEHPWAILPSKLLQLEAVVSRHVAGEKLDAEQVQAAINGAQRPADRRVNAVAVLPLFGTIFPRANMMTDISGATSAERFAKQFTELVNDSGVNAIVLDVDSPGGQVGGIEELSKLIYDARGKKPIVAVANHTMASAAYWIGTAAEELVVTPSGQVGSIGVFTVHEDISAALEQEGTKVTLISAGKYKVEGNPYEALSEEARTAIQTRVSETYETFVEAVARNRGVNPANVRGGFGEGRMVRGRQAVQLGMADRIGTLDEVISELLTKTYAPVAGLGAETVKPALKADSSDLAQVTDEHAAKRLRDYVLIYK